MGIDPRNAARHRSATADDPADPELIDGRLVRGDAVFSPCRTWRWRLTREWEGGTGAVFWLMLNPSTADAVRVDPTVRRAVSFSMRWGAARALVGNVFGLRATSPQHLYTHPDPVGPDNDEHLAALAREADRIVVAWGNHARHGERYRSIARILRPHAAKCVCLSTTKGGMPGHPLYLRADTVPTSARELLARLSD
jgi:hypothetical protein